MTRAWAAYGLSTYSSTEESWITKRFSLMAFAETGTFNINDGRNANKNYLLSSDLQSDGLCGVRNRANQLWMKISTCRTAHTWKNMIRGSWLDVSLFSHVGKAIRDIWLVYIGLRTKIYSAAFQCVNLSMYIIKVFTLCVHQGINTSMAHHHIKSRISGLMDH